MSATIIKFVKDVPAEELPTATCCSFCKKDRSKCKRFAAAGLVGICDECAATCATLMKDPEEDNSEGCKE